MIYRRVAATATVDNGAGKWYHNMQLNFFRLAMPNDCRLRRDPSRLRLFCVHRRKAKEEQK